MRLPRDVHPASLSRLPLLERGELDEEGQKHYDAVVSPASRTLVGLRGPSGIWLHSPKLAGFLAYWLKEIVEPNLSPKTYEKYEMFTRLRPWLQAFDAQGVVYDATKVRAEIDAAENNGSLGWMLWNYDNSYTEGAIKAQP